MKKYYFLPIGAFCAFDIWASSEKEARKTIREMMNKKTLHGVQFWKA